MAAIMAAILRADSRGSSVQNYPPGNFVEQSSHSHHVLKNTKASTPGTDFCILAERERLPSAVMASCSLRSAPKSRPATLVELFGHLVTEFSIPPPHKIKKPQALLEVS
jgi:hypothetical protein